MIQIQNLKLSFVKEYYALYDINLVVVKGEKFGIIGGSDSGKTSLLRILAKLQDFSSGIVKINGLPLKSLNYKKDLSVAFVPTHPILFENKSVRQNLEYVLKIRKILKENQINLISNVLHDFSLDSCSDTKVKFLSSYQKRLLQFAMLSIRDHIDLLLIDEIFEDLPEKEKNNILKIVKKLASKQGTTTILATNDEKIAKSICDRTVNLVLGSIKI